MINKIRKSMLIALHNMLNLTVVLFLIIAVQTACAPSPRDRMPELVGQTYYGELENKLKESNFNVTLTVDKKLIPGSSGIVISQVPAAGENLPEADKNGFITIVLTISPVIVQVPNVSGMTYPAAQSQLYSLGLASSRLIKITQSAPGLVLDQLPAANTNVAIGTKITLTVSQVSPMLVEDDGCAWQGQTCICSETGWSRHCNYGPHRAGLYCQCD
jgi:beta-lactam-binding protein with PASTA domain